MKLKLHPALEELLVKTGSELEDVALLVADAVEQLEEGNLVGALGALSGCDARIRDAAIVIRAADRWQVRLAEPSTRQPHAPSESAGGAPDGATETSAPGTEGTDTSQKGDH